MESKVQHHVYSAFGQLVKILDNNSVDVTASPPLAVFFSYTGREYDSESGMYYYRARFYDASIGRFIETDPDPGRLGSPLSFNSKYIYAYNNPINLIDPSGKFSLRSVG